MSPAAINARSPSPGRLLPVEDAARAAPLRHWSDSIRSRVATWSVAVVEEWRQAWGLQELLGTRRLGCTVRGAGEAPFVHDEWGAAFVGAGLWCTIVPLSPAAGPPTVPDLGELSKALIGEDGGEWALRERADGPRIADELVQVAWADLRRRFADEFHPAAVPEIVPSGPAHLGRWSGAMVVQVPLGRSELRVLVAGEVVERLAGRREPRTQSRRRDPVTSIWRAVSDEVVHVDVGMQAFDLDLGSLASIRVGDLLRTAHRLDRPLAVHYRVPGGRGRAEMCVGYLGKVGSARALLLARSGEPTRRAEPEARTIDVSEERANMEDSPTNGPVAAQPIVLPELGSSRGEGAQLVEPGTEAANPLRNVRVRITVRLGGTELTIGELLAVKAQQVLRLDQGIDDAVEVVLEGQVVARGTLVAVDDSFGVRITEVPAALELPLGGARKVG